jgi:hypothetical protein
VNITQSPNMASAYNSSRYNPPTNLSVGCNPLKTFQTPNTGLAQKVIRTNLSSLYNSLGVAQILCLTVGYSQKKKDSVQAVLIQRYTNYNSLRVSVTNYPNGIGSVQRLPDDIGLVQYILSAIGGQASHSAKFLAQSLAGDTGCIHMNISSTGGRDLNHGNDIHSVDDLALLCNSSRATSRSNFISLLALIPISSIRERVSSADINGSLPAPLVCLRAISLRIAATINPALLSPSCLTDSMPSMTPWGTRIVVICDFAFLYTDIVNHQFVVCISIYTKMRYKNTCNAYHQNISCISYCGVSVSRIIGIANMTKPDSVVAHAGLLTTTDNTSIEEAMKDHITPVTGRNSFTPNIKFLWRFFSCQQSRYFTVEARSEQEARSMLPDAPCLFSARFRQSLQNVVGVSA